MPIFIWYKALIIMLCYLTLFLPVICINFSTVYYDTLVAKGLTHSPMFNMVDNLKHHFHSFYKYSKVVSNIYVKVKKCNNGELCILLGHESVLYIECLWR